MYGRVGADHFTAAGRIEVRYLRNIDWSRTMRPESLITDTLPWISEVICTACMIHRIFFSDLRLTTPRRLVLDVTPARPEGSAAGVLMNLAHFHIVVNHVPSLGSILGLLLLAMGIYKKDETIKQSAYFVLVLITMAILPTYVSGAEAQRIVKTSASYSAGMVQLHQNMAMLTLLAMTFAGMFAW